MALLVTATEEAPADKVKRAARAAFQNCLEIAARVTVPATHHHFEGRMHAWSEVLQLFGETAECTCPACVFVRGVKR